MSRQTILFLYTVGVGAIIGFAYDIFRVLRKTAPHKAALVQIEDLFFWLAATALMFYFILNASYGEIRLHSILGAGLGMVLYFATLSKLVIKLFVIIINFLKRVIATAVRILLMPINLLIGLLAPYAKSAAQVCYRYLHQTKLYGKMKLRKAARDLRIIRKKV